jgi:hypothetical protein
MTVRLRHRSALLVGTEGHWDLDSVRKTIQLVLPSGTLATISVCAPIAPRFGAAPLVRRDGTSWQIEAARYTARAGSDTLFREEHVHHPEIGSGPVVLTNAPGDVVRELIRLGR